MDLTKFFYEIRQSRITEEFPPRDLYPLYYKARRHEFIVKEGSMLLIPTGWFHFVFSEDPNPECGLNASFHFVYRHFPDWIEGKTGSVLPRMEPSIVPPIDNLTEFIGEDTDMNVLSNPNKIFGSNNIEQRLPGISSYSTTLGKFVKKRSSKDYILLNGVNKLEHLKPDYGTDLISAGVSISFGHVTTTLHYDHNDVWLCQVKGTKRIILFRPEDRDFLYLWNDYPLELIYKLAEGVNVRKWWLTNDPY
jgi:hypothetical protein